MQMFSHESIFPLVYLPKSKNTVYKVIINIDIISMTFKFHFRNTQQFCLYCHYPHMFHVLNLVFRFLMQHTRHLCIPCLKYGMSTDSITYVCLKNIVWKLNSIHHMVDDILKEKKINRLSLVKILRNFEEQNESREILLSHFSHFFGQYQQALAVVRHYSNLI